ncbi:MAG: RecX family transcriptional regulator [Chrysiogenetes bacterium]|nr:RecX family transcriptional regulator [Chrysiogenetes bacterium]
MSLSSKPEKHPEEPEEETPSERGRRKRPTALVCAVTYLARSLVPESRLRRYLEGKEYEAAEVDEVVERLKREGFLNEKRLAESRMSELAEKRGYWGAALSARMRKDGFSDENRAHARELLESQHKPADLALSALERRYGERWWEKPERRLASYLERHGFSPAIIIPILRRRRALRREAEAGSKQGL